MKRNFQNPWASFSSIKLNPTKINLPTANTTIVIAAKPAAAATEMPVDISVINKRIIQVAFSIFCISK